MILFHSHSLRNIFISRFGTHLWLGLLVVSSCIQIHILEHLPPLPFSATYPARPILHRPHIWWEQQIMMLLITYYSLCPCCFISVMYIYFPQNFVPCCSQYVFCPVDMREHVPHWPFIDWTIVPKQKMRQRKKKSSNTKAKQKTFYLKWYSGRFDSWSFFQPKLLFHARRAYNMWQQLR
jgi:hypothetical protein